MTATHAIIAAEIEAEIAAERYHAAHAADEHPEFLDALATEADRAQRRFEDLLMRTEGTA